MNAARKRLAIPSLAERIEAIKEEASAALDHEAEIQRPKGEGRAIPAASMRQMWLAHANGNVIDAYLIAVKEGT